MDALLKKSQEKSDDLNLHLFTVFNNCVQMTHFNHQSTPVFIRDIIKQIKKTGSLINLPNNRTGSKKMMRILANSLYNFRVLASEEEEVKGPSLFVPSDKDSS